MRALRLGPVVLLFVLPLATACGSGDAEVVPPGGDAGDAGNGDGGACYAASFVAPVDAQVLRDTDDLDGDCSNGFAYDVRVAVAAPEGTAVSLLSDGVQIASATVEAASATFSNVQLDVSASSALTLRVAGDASCDVSINIGVQCEGIPSCSVQKPEITPLHPELNAVPASEGGDRVSAAGAPYQVAFEVQTSVEDGQLVSLTVDDAETSLSVQAAGGAARFPGVTLAPDGDHRVSARCVGKDGKMGISAEKTYPVDTVAPEFASVKPSSGQFFGPDDDADPATPGVQFDVCAGTESSDALDLPSSLGARQNNFCVSVGTGSPNCVPATAGGAGSSSGACQRVTCPGGAPFDLKLTLLDDAGNPNATTVQGVSCASSLPSVQIVEPVDGAGGDITKHILAANHSQSRRDIDPNASGAQYNVTACTDAAGGSAVLRVGLQNGAMEELGSPVALSPAQASDACPMGLTQVARFNAATLLESVEGSDGELLTPTQLEVEVTDAALAKGESPPVLVWVDSVAPKLAPLVPSPLCGQSFQSADSLTLDLQLSATTVPVDLSVVGPGGTHQYQGTTLNSGRVAINGVLLELGSNELSASAAEPSGNVGALKSPCTASVGNPPIVNWVSPTVGSQLNAGTDGAAAQPGWQGTLSVSTDVGGSGASVQFSTVPGGNIGAPVAVDAGGNALLANATIPEGDNISIVATTSDVPGRGVGKATLVKVVDVVAPSAVTSLTASVKDRRQTTFALSWTAAADGSKSVFDYDVRYARSAVDAANFDSLPQAPFGGIPGNPGSTDGVDVADLFIENDYYFAVRTRDKAGNRGPIVSTGPVRASFNLVTLVGGSLNKQYGFSLDGSLSVNGDALADLLVGSTDGSEAHLYFGSATGYSTTPDVRFVGPPSQQFGSALAVVGDIDDDGLEDIAIGSPVENTVYVFKGRTQWPSVLTEPTEADYRIVADDTVDPGFVGSLFGSTLARLGDFDGDGVDDFAVGSAVYRDGSGGFIGHASVVLGAKTMAAVQSVPQAYGTGAIAITGDPVEPDGRLGFKLLGLGRYYNTTGTTLIASAPRAESNAGRLYSIVGQPRTVGTISVLNADHTATGAPGSRMGYALSLLGDVSGTAALDVAVGAPALAGQLNGTSTAFFGSPALGPFGGSKATFYNELAPGGANRFGMCVFGGGFSARSIATSFIGDSHPDVAISGGTESGGPAKLYILDATTVSSATGAAAVDVSGAADVVYPLPSDWLGCSYNSSAINDLNGDGYGDIGLGEFDLTTGYPGRVLVLW